MSNHKWVPGRELVRVGMLFGLSCLSVGCGAGGGGANHEGESEIGSIDEAIIGGSIATPHEFPYMVYMGGCGGALVSDRWVLTAGHCVGKVVAAGLGEHDINVNEGTEQVKTLGRQYAPFWSFGKYNNDIGLVELTTPATFNANVQPIYFHTSQGRPGEIATAMGWGKTSPTGVGSPVLKKTPQIIRTDATCDPGIAWDSLICAGNSIGNPGTCQGDSGSPLVVKRNDLTYVTALVSGGNPGCNTYGRFTDVAAFAQWIRNTIWGAPTVAARMSDGVVYERHMNESTGVWTSWKGISGTAAGGPGMTVDAAGRPYAFACNAGQVVWSRTLDGINWSAWSSIGGNCTGTPHAIMNGDAWTAFEIFARGSDGLVRNTVFQGQPSVWTSLGSGTISAGVSVTLTRYGRLMVFGRSGTSIVYRYRDPEQSTWSSWISLGGGSFASAPAAYETAEGRLHVFATQSNGQIMYRYWNPLLGSNGDWSASWSAVGSGFSTSAAPAISEYDGGSKIFLWASASNSLWYNLFDLKTYAFGGWSNSLAGGKTLSSGPGAF